MLQQFVSPIRAFSSSACARGIFSRSTNDPPSLQAAPSTSQPEPSIGHDADVSLTPFQTRIAALETAALAHPDDGGKQVDLLRALQEGGEWRGIVAYYEAMALSSGQPSASETDVQSGVRSKALLQSGEAWTIYVEGLAKMGRLSDVASLVRRRDLLLSSLGITSTAAPSPSATSSSASSGSSILSSLRLGSGGNPSAQPPSASSSSSPLASSSSANSEQQPPSMGLPLNAGTPLSPIYVQMAPQTPQANFWKVFRWLLGVLLWVFVGLTVLSMFMENTGLLKAGPGPVEFEPEEGKIVRFKDVHGVEEAKSVSTKMQGCVQMLIDLPRSSRRLSNSSKTLRSSRLSAASCPRVSYLRVRLVPERRCWLEPLPARPTCPSCLPVAAALTKCLSVLAVSIPSRTGLRDAGQR